MYRGCAGDATGSGRGRRRLRYHDERSHIHRRNVLDTLSVIADGPSTQEEGQAAADDGGLEQADED